MAFGSGRIGGGYSLGNNNYKSYNVAAGLGAGLAYNANDRLLITLSLPDVVSAYVNYSTEDFTNTSDRIRTFNTGINSNVSFQTFQAGILFMRK